MQKEAETNLLADYINGLYTTDGENGLYLHDADLTNGANDGSLRYAGANYKLTSLASTYDNVDDYDSTANGLIKFYCSDGPESSFVGWPYSNNTIYNIYYYYLATDPDTHYNTYDEVVNAAKNAGYIKDRVSNYVCFGYDDTTKAYASNWCPNDNLYRIIGVYGDHVKLIKSDYATNDLLGEDGDFKKMGSIISSYKGKNIMDYTYYWNYKNQEQSRADTQKRNIWSYSELNKTNLNKNYLSNIGENWSNLIIGTTWKVGGNTIANIRDSVVATAYQNEIINPVTEPVGYVNDYKARVGVMYVNEYGYAADPNSWEEKLIRYGNGVMNWMYMGQEEWIMTRFSDSPNYVAEVDDAGSVFTCFSKNDNLVRPAFSLSSSAKFMGGSGTSSDPYRISR